MKFIIEFIGKFSNQIVAITTVITSFFAYRSLTLWRKQMVGKSKYEKAKKTLIAVYKVGYYEDWIRPVLDKSYKGKYKKKELLKKSKRI